jgi:NAD-dependent dihydropyrimidine dehydrogenase PreA subunit
VVVARDDVEFILEPDRCCGCKRCIHTCQEDVWRWDADMLCAVPRYPEECVKCYQCEADCLGNCFDIKPTLVMQSDPLENPVMAD